MTWQAVVPIVCFMYARMHHADRVKRQFGGEQQIPEDPVKLDGLLGASARREDQHWPTRHAVSYDAWRGRFAPEHQITITPTQYPAMPTHAYFEWWLDACRVQFLSPADALDDPRLDGLLDDVPATASQPRDRLSLPGDVSASTRQRRAFRPDIRRQACGGVGRGAGATPERPVGAIDSEEEAKYERQEDVAGVAGDGGATGTQARAAAAAAEHLAPIRAPPPVVGEDMSWILPITPFTWFRQHRSSIPSVRYAIFMGVSREPQRVRWFTASVSPAASASHHHPTAA
ncbi:hypothetical protein PIB30_035506 [Stylosanthes scabra]|uniref:Aminotransferase-like plant mobile domain-containing protein n=1 Tax=Stylosanthes scabra TaxID=79078 RepID=A0ABU6YC32_9FABA|nr:hypothetical protein [Stylosanthes scabra]